MKAGVGEIDLTLNTDGSNDLKTRRHGDQVLEQRRLADAGLAAD
jgi:hypothetical protein